MKSIRFSAVFGVLLLTLLNTINSFGQIYSYKNFNHLNGLLHGATWGITEKKDGGILIGTQGAGIVEYDGYTFHETIATDQDNNHHVTGIEVINDKILFTSRFKGVFQINESGNLSLLFKQKNTGDYIELEYFKDFLIIVTQFNLYTYDFATKKSIKVSNFKHQGNDLKVYETIKTPKGCVFLTNKGNYILTKKDQLIPLNQFFRTDNQLLEKMVFGYNKNGLLHLFDKEVQTGMIVELTKNKLNFKEKKIEHDLNADPLSIISTTYNEKKNRFAFFTYNGDLFEENDFVVKKVPNNNQYKKIAANKVITDYNGDYWVTTHITGVFKIGLQPFTKLNLHKEFSDQRINHVFKTQNNNIIFSNIHGNTYTGHLYKGKIKHHSICILTSTIINNTLYVGTTSGIYEYTEKPDRFKKITIPGIDSDKKIQFISYQSPYIWMNIADEGLYKLDKNFNLIRHYKEENHAPYTIYTGQFSDDGNYLYMGTSNGVRKLDISREIFSAIGCHDLGDYCGLSVKDIFGTSWFTLEKGIMGISRRGELFILSSPFLFPSYLFYTINTDNFGNLIIGTNKGLNVIQINDKGKVLNQRNFNPGTGFEGYETHMRASFQDNNYALVGTIEGLYYLDFNLLQQLPFPQKPVIQVQNKKTDSSQTPVLSFQFLSKNPKVRNVLYAYRIINHQNKWSSPSYNDEISIADLKSGTYTLEVKATYDGITYSKVAQYPIKITMPLLRSNLLIVALITIVFTVILLFYSHSKKNASYEIFYSEEFSLTQKYVPSLILFGFISHVLTNQITHFISDGFEVNQSLVIITGIALLYTFLRAKHNKKKKANKKVKNNLITAFYIVMLFNIYSLHETSLHPFYGFSVILTGSVAAFIFDKTKSIVIYTFIFVGVNIVVILSSAGLNYDKYLLIIPIVISGLLSVFMNLIRYDSVHQLAFISSIINKSNILALVMNREGLLKYISKNITCYINIQATDLIDQPISLMNKFIPSGVTGNIDLKSEFRDGKRFLSPLLNTRQEISWFEWSCKEFSEDIRILIGQDITEKMNLQNTYEILVENAEDLIYQVDLDGNFQFLNNRFNDYLSYDKSKLLGKNLSDILPKDYKEIVFDYYKKQFKNREKVSYFEFPMFNSNDQVQWFGQYVTLLFSVGDSSKVVGFLAVGRNITEKIKKDSIIALQRADITASINYAKRIQLNLLPPSEKIATYFPESFVIYKPKDIVSGDFYWCNQLGEYTIVAVGDGTGHGVPGAFMSILGINLLNSIIMEKHIHDPGRILDELDTRLKEMLSAGNHQQKINDGMEITVCVFNERKESLEYACAGSKLIIHDGQTFSIRKGDNKHIGDFHKDFQGYVTHHQTIGNEMTTYLFTDGFHDQFGGIQQKKYSIRRLLELFIRNISLPLHVQQSIIEQEFDNWQLNTDQTDDVTVIGLRKSKHSYDKIN